MIVKSDNDMIVKSDNDNNVIAGLDPAIKKRVILYSEVIFENTGA